MMKIESTEADGSLTFGAHRVKPEAMPEFNWLFRFSNPRSQTRTAPSSQDHRGCRGWR